MLSCFFNYRNQDLQVCNEEAIYFSYTFAVRVAIKRAFMRVRLKKPSFNGNKILFISMISGFDNKYKKVKKNKYFFVMKQNLI